MANLNIGNSITLTRAHKCKKKLMFVAFYLVIKSGLKYCHFLKLRIDFLSHFRVGLCLQ